MVESSRRLAFLASHQRHTHRHRRIIDEHHRMTSLLPVQLSDVQAAAKRIAPYINRTPVHTSTSLNAISKYNLYFKCENFQKGGAFKARGAHNAVFSVSDEQAAKGVVTHSSGNHAQACALAALARAIPAHIVMPNTAPQVKKNAVRGYGANVIECEPSERAAKAAEIAQETGGLLIHPSNDPRVIAGQGTVALEFLQQMTTLRQLQESVQPLDVLVVPLGGGGLISGICACAKGLWPDLRIIAAEPSNADDAYRSKSTGGIVPHRDNHPNTIADGLCTLLGSNTFPFVRDCVEEIITVKECEIAAGMRYVYERMKLVLEPSAGTGVAAVLFNQRFKDLVDEESNVGIILCGGNIDLMRMTEYMALAESCPAPL
jgi:threonine dehydratase